MIEPLTWNDRESRVELLDQTLLPEQEVWLHIENPETMAEAIRQLRVRGAPAIGIAAAYGVVLALSDQDEEDAPYEKTLKTIEMLAQTRPTAVNLFWALNRMRQVLVEKRDLNREALREALLETAHAIRREDQEAGRKLGEYGLSLLQDGMTVLTHCHTGGVATSGYGTALAPLLISREHGLNLSAFVDETRPLLQGSRITAWELVRSGIDATLITDSMAGHVMQQGKVQAVFVGADRIAANGDVANKIGTYSLAVLASAHGVPFYVSAPISTIDMDTPDGSHIKIEERPFFEITNGFGRRTAPEGVNVYNPAFDVTPSKYVSAIITERGIVYPPYGSNLRKIVLLQDPLNTTLAT